MGRAHFAAVGAALLSLALIASVFQSGGQPTELIMVGFPTALPSLPDSQTVFGKTIRP